MSHIILIIRIGTKSVKKEHSFCCYLPKLPTTITTIKLDIYLLRVKKVINKSTKKGTPLAMLTHFGEFL